MYLFQSYTTQCQNSERNQPVNNKFILLKPTQFGFKPGHKPKNSLVGRNTLFFSIHQKQTSALILDYFAVIRLGKSKILLIHSRKVARSQGYRLKWLYKWILHHQFPYLQSQRTLFFSSSCMQLLSGQMTSTQVSTTCIGYTACLSFTTYCQTSTKMV